MLFAVNLCMHSEPEFYPPHRGNFCSVKGGSLRTVGGWGVGLPGAGAMKHAHTRTTNNPHVIKSIVCPRSSKKKNVLNFHCS